MANALISHPFRLMPNGSIATLDEDSDAYMAERISLVMSIQPGERPLVPLFGVRDPAFEGLLIAALKVQMDTFEIPVTIVSITENVINQTLTDYTVEFTREGDI